MDTSLKFRIDEASLSAFYAMAKKKKYSVNSLVNDFIRLYVEDGGSQWAAKIIPELHKDVPIETPLLVLTDFTVLKIPLRQLDAKCELHKQPRSQFLRAAINSYTKGAWIYYV